MKLTGNENHEFPLTTAAEWTKSYRDNNPPSATKAHYFGKAAIQALLTQTDCVGMRIYYALDDEGEKQLIIVGVDEDGDDLYEGLIAERSISCPVVCSSANPLNTTIAGE
jgi:hypothetical protein